MSRSPRIRTRGYNALPDVIRSDSMIAEEYFRRTGERLTAEGVRQIAKRAAKKIRAAMERKAG